LPLIRVGALVALHRLPLESGSARHIGATMHRCV